MNLDQLSPEDLQKILDDPMKRICTLYKIIIKGDDDDDGLVIQFKPNKAQRRLISRLHHRNLILKARQMGFTTLVAILWLDTALFSKSPIRCGIIAQDKPSAENIFADKVKFAYDHLPEILRERFPLARDSASELKFAHNGASIRVSTSMRSGTIHRLHISEYGKICAKYPDKAKEVVTGSIPAVPLNGILIIESTAEGMEGDFYTKIQKAKAHDEKKRALTQKDYRLHFFAWWEADEYELDPDDVLVSEVHHKYFNELEQTIGRPISPRKRAWYVATLETDFSGEAPLMWQEFPSTCVTGDTYVSTTNGMVRIKDVFPDGKIISNHLDQGIKPVFRLRTKLGYTINCTADHKILCADGEYRQLDALELGEGIRLGRPGFGSIEQRVEYRQYPFMTNSVDINEDFAEFLGIYMGDGSFYNGQISVACDAQDLDTVDRVEHLISKFLGASHSRVTGDKKGCLEIRMASIGLLDPFLALGIIKQRNLGGYKRHVHVPEYIMRSPKAVAAAFIRGLFEADGFASRDGCSVKFFSKYEHVCLDVQRLLLAFGIECRVSCMEKKSGSGGSYKGWELVLRSDGVRKFATEIRFISKRKQDRANLALSKRATGGRSIFDWTDTVASIEPMGIERVYDITTETSSFIAGGIVVHNCDEAFQVSTEGCYYAEQMARARKEGRILKALPIVPVPVNTFWDLGRGDMTTLWCHQRATLQDRFLSYYENSGEELIHYVTHLQLWAQEKRVTFGTHYLPHDAEYKRLGATPDTNKSIKELLQDLWPGQRFEIVPRITALQSGIQATRSAFGSAWFDEEGCAEGIKRLSNYRKRWNKALGCWADDELHDSNSHGADAFRQWGQEVANGNVFANAAARNSTFKRRGSAMAV